ncbi:hypothetical protein VMT40_16590 [Nocardia sp. CDC160]|nr:hypothetical protein [Nocardia sp. CDC160]
MAPQQVVRRPVQAVVPVVAGQVTQVYYRAPTFGRAPVSRLTTGVIGPVPPQPDSTGLGWFIGAAIAGFATVLMAVIVFGSQLGFW